MAQQGERIGTTIPTSGSTAGKTPTKLGHSRAGNVCNDKEIKEQEDVKSQQNKGCRTAMSATA